MPDACCDSSRCCCCCCCCRRELRWIINIKHTRPAYAHRRPRQRHEPANSRCATGGRSEAQRNDDQELMRSVTAAAPPPPSRRVPLVATWDVSCPVSCAAPRRAGNAWTVSIGGGSDRMALGRWSADGVHDTGRAALITLTYGTAADGTQCLDARLHRRD